MDMNLFTSRMIAEVDRSASVSGSHSRAFLKWFLVNYYRIDEDTAPYYVCDNPNDKGIDGIYIDDLSSEIFVLQAKYTSTPGSDQGDADLRNFDGVKAWFQSPENVQSLDDSLANKELKGIISRLELLDKIRQGYMINLVFITNKIFDKNGKEYLKVVGDYYDAWDLNKLFGSYTYTEKDKPVAGGFSFNIGNENIIPHRITDDVEVSVFAAKATDIVQLQGIQDQSLFHRNVRYGLGKTRINRAIAKTIKTVSDHDSFLLFNNGITVICEGFELVEGKLNIQNYAVVNGCQTVLTLYENKNFLDDRVRVFTRIIKTGTDEALGERITFYNNNQNPINVRDLKSNDKVQEVIQRQVLDYFDNKILYNIKRGESEEGYEIVIPNDFVAQLIASFVLRDSYITHQKTQLFTEHYQRIFSRHINPPLIHLLWLMYMMIDNNCAAITNPGARDYKTTRFFIMYLFREIFDKDEVGRGLVVDSDTFYKTYGSKCQEAFDKLSKMLIIGFNNYIATQQEQDNEQFFDYKNILRNEKLTKNMARDIISKYETSLIFQPEGKVSSLLAGQQSK